MNTLSSARDALARVPGLDVRELDVRKLSGGLSNRSYLVKQGQERWVLRLDPRVPGAFQPDRELELRALQTAAAAGLAPEVVFADPATGVLLCRYLDGRALPPAALQHDDKLHAIGLLMREVHALPLCGTRISMPDTAIVYRDYIERHGEPNRFARYCVDAINAQPPADRVRFCHNDIVAANIIGNGRLRLIDWEFAGDNAPLFDLASLIGFHDLDERQAGVLLESYLGRADAAARQALLQQRIVYDAIQWLWLAARQEHSAAAGDKARLSNLEARLMATA